MVSAAERLAANANFGLLSKATELKKRLLFVLGALIVFRIGTYVPIPGIDPQIMAQLFHQQSGGILDVFNMFSGGALSRMAIFSLALTPYISASIAVQFLGYAIPSLAALKKEGAAGQQKLNQYTRYLTVVVAAVQSYGAAAYLESGALGPVVIDPGMFFRFTTVLTLVGGTVFLMWLSDQITARGVGYGSSMIIYAGIVAGLPEALARTFDLGRTGALSGGLILVIMLLVIGLIALIVFLERAQRRIIVQYPKRQVGNRMYGGENSHLPMKFNMTGVLPPICASILLVTPLSIVKFASGSTTSSWMQWISTHFTHGQPLFALAYVAVIAMLSFFLNGVVFNTDDVAENLKKNGGFVAGIRPGKNTSDYLHFVLTRLTVIGALYLSLVCVVPEFLVARSSVPFYLGGTSLLIVVSVTMEFVTQVQSHLFAHQYEGLIRKAKLKGRL